MSLFLTQKRASESELLSTYARVEMEDLQLQS